MTKHEAEALRDAGLSVEEIAAALSVEPPQVDAWLNPRERVAGLRAAGLASAHLREVLGVTKDELKALERPRHDPTKPCPQVDDDALLEMVEDGMSLSEIATALNVNYDSARQRIRRLKRRAAQGVVYERSLANQERERASFSDAELATERWVNALNLPGYEVSDLGRVRSWKRPGPNPDLAVEPHLLVARIINGYRTVQVNLRSRSVGPLVLESFGPPPPSRFTRVRHLDGNHLNDRLSNLAWSTDR